MALTESIEYDKIEIVGEHKAVQVREAHVIKKDGELLSKVYKRYVLNCGSIDASDNFIDTDISSQPTEVQAICNAAWTTEAKDAYKALLIKNKLPT